MLLGRIPGRRAPEEITLYESLGVAVEDLAAATSCSGARRRPARGRSSRGARLPMRTADATASAGFDAAPDAHA